MLVSVAFLQFSSGSLQCSKQWQICNYPKLCISLNCNLIYITWKCTWNIWHWLVQNQTNQHQVLRGERSSYTYMNHVSANLDSNKKLEGNWYTISQSPYRPSLEPKCAIIVSYSLLYTTFLDILLIVWFAINNSHTLLFVVPSVELQHVGMWGIFSSRLTILEIPLNHMYLP